MVGRSVTRTCTNTSSAAGSSRGRLDAFFPATDEDDDREPGHLPSDELLAQMGQYNEELSKAGVLLDLAALHWSAEGVRVNFSGGKRTVIEGPFGEAGEIIAGYWIFQVKSMEEAMANTGAGSGEAWSPAVLACARRSIVSPSKAG